MHQQVRCLFNNCSSALLEQELHAMRAARTATCRMYDAAGHPVYVSRASILAELEIRCQEEELPWDLDSSPPGASS